MSTGQGVRVPPDVLEAMLDGKKPRELYRITWLSKVHPNDGDLSQVALAQVVAHLWAQDQREADQIFSNNVPEDFPVLCVIAIAPVGGIEENSMLEIARGPRAIH